MDPAQTQAFLDLLEAIENSGGEAAEKVKELAKAFSNLSAQQIEAIKSSGTLSGAQADAAAARTRQLEQIKLSAAAQLQEAEAAADAARSSKDKKAAIQAENKAIEARIKLLYAERDAEIDVGKKRELTEKIKEANEQLGENEEQLKKVTSAAGSLKKGLDDLATGLGEVGKSMIAGEESGKKFMSAIGGIGDKAIGSIQGALISSLGPVGPAMAGIVGAAYEFGKAILQLAIQMSDASKEIQKATGVSDSFAKSIVSGYEETRRFGGSLKELTAAGTELSKTFTDFTMMNEDAARSLAVTATMMGKIGVSNADFAKGVQLSTKALGATTEQAEQTQLNLAQLAMDIGVAPSQMAADFASAGPHLAKFGSDAERAFKSLAITAKSTGIEVGRLLQITEKFDTFEGAAEQAGKLNAALGGNFVNAMEMMTETDPAARFDMMTGAIKEAGLSFDEMSYYQRKFYADAMGLADVSELALALSGNTALLGKEAQKTSADYEQMAERAATVQNFQERLNMVFAEMIPIVEPLVELLEEAVVIMQENTEVVKAFGVAFTVLGVGIAAASLPIWSTAGAVTALIAAVSGVAYFLFEKQYASNFLEGIVKLGDAFGNFAIRALEILNPFHSMSKLVDSVGVALSSIIGNATELFEVLASDRAAANILKIATAIASIPTLKNIEFAASMGALAAANSTAAMANTAAMAKAAIMQKSSPIVATSNAVSSAMYNSSQTNTTNSSQTNTTNNNGSGVTKVEIGLADGFKDMFSAKVLDTVVTKGMGGLL